MNVLAHVLHLCNSKKMSQKKKILIADDESDILEILQFNLEAEGYDVMAAKNGNEAIEKAKIFSPDLIILDVMMPGKTGIEACKILRNLPAFSKTLIIFLTAMSDEFTEVSSLEAGGDDFLKKPIRPKVLLTKVSSLFRRLDNDSVDSSYIPFRIDRERYLVIKDNQELTLAKKEFELLALLASKPGKVFLRHEILTQIWGTEVIVGDRTIDVHIRKIRQKLGIDCIITVKGVGYKFEI